MRIAVASLLLLAGAARADTLGLPPCTPPVAEWRLARAAAGAPPVVVARDPAAWREVWRRVGGTGAAPEVDFERLGAVGVTTTARDGLVIYRVQLDDVAAPRALEVRVAERATFCDHQPGPPAPAVHLVAVPRSALPVRFVLDRMIDGHMFGMGNEGTDERALGEAPAGIVPPGSGVRLREDAERRVLRALTPAELTALRRGPVGGEELRFPHLWLRLAVERAPDRWRIRYDQLRFEVDVAGGAVRRIP